VARNHGKPTTGAAATYSQLGEYVAANVEGGMDSFDLRQRADRTELQQIADRLEQKRRLVADGGTA
jgi:hypothetical protein